MNLLHKNGIVICHKKVEKTNFLCFANLTYLIEMCPPTSMALAINMGQKVYNYLYKSRGEFPLPAVCRLPGPPPYFYCYL